MTSILEQMAILFIIIAIGYIANKTKVMSPEADKAITKLVINVTMPCMILNSVWGDRIDMSISDILFFVAMIVASFFIAMAIAFIFVKLKRGDKTDNGLICYLSSFSNVGFMGLPIALAVFGESSLFYVALFNIPYAVMGFSAGVLMISRGSGKIGLKKLLLTPPLITVIIAIILYLLHINAPPIIKSTASLVGNMTTPAAMLVVGSLLASLPLKNVFSEARLYIVAGIKLLVIPFAIWLIFKQFITNPLALGVLVLLSATPSPTIATMIAMEYGGNDRLASKGVFITTLFSVVTIPLIIYLLI